MISFCQSLPVGNAVRVILAPASDAAKVRLLRKSADTISGPDDAGSALIYEDFADGIECVIDTAALTNGAVYYYRAFDLIDDEWVGSESVSVLVTAISQLLGPDPIELLRDRLEVGLKIEAAATKFGRNVAGVSCMTTQPTFEGATWPMVTIHLQRATPQVRGIGEIIAEDIFDEAEGEWVSSEGWIDQYTILVIGWCADNGDLRDALGRAIRKVLLANMIVFNGKGISEFEFSQSNIEDMESYSVPVFQTHTTITCLAPSIVTSRDVPISDVTAEPYVA